MKTIILVLIAVALGVFAVCAVIQNIKIKNKLNTEKKKEKQNAKIDEHTIEQIESITCGDVNNDFNAGVDLLHNLANRK